VIRSPNFSLAVAVVENDAQVGSQRESAFSGPVLHRRTFAFGGPVCHRRVFAFGGPLRRWRVFAFGGPVRRRAFAFSGRVCHRRLIALKEPFSTTELDLFQSFSFGLQRKPKLKLWTPAKTQTNC
jgi:hypothetical protein